MRSIDSRTPDETAPGATLQMACFVVGGNVFGLDIMNIAEVINPAPITPVPGAPEFVEGIAELRGVFIPVVDLRKRFGVSSSRPDSEAKYVVATVGGHKVGLIVDAVLDVRRVDTASVQPPPIPAALDRARRRLVSGVVHASGEVVLILDLEHALSQDEQRALAMVQSGGARDGRDGDDGRDPG